MCGGGGVGEYPVKPSCLEGDSQTIDTFRCNNNLIGCSTIDILLASLMGFESTPPRYTLQKPTAQCELRLGHYADEMRTAFFSHTKKKN